MCFLISSSKGFVKSSFISSPPNTVKYSTAVSKSFGLFFLQKALNWFFVDSSINMMGIPLEYFS